MLFALNSQSSNQNELSIRVGEYVKELALKFKPERVILFGSQARQAASENSDVDLLVILPFTGRSSQQALKIRKAIKKSFPLDLLVKTPRQVESCIRMGDPLISAAFSEGIVLYERR